MRVTLDQDKPPVWTARTDIVDLPGYPVLGAPYPGAKVLVGRAAQRDAEHEAAVINLIADREHGQAELAVVGESANALGFRNLTNYIARSLLEADGFRPRLHPRLR